MWKRSERTKKVDCQQVEAWLVAYLKEGLSPQRRQMVEDHLAACAACARSVQQTQILESELRLQAAHHQPTLSAKASARIHERVYRRMRRGLIMQRTVKLVGVAIAVAAIIVLAAGAMALWQGRPPDVAGEQDATPQLTPVPPTQAPATAVPATDTPQASSDTPTFTGSGRIAFTSDRDGNKEIYVMDSSGLTRLTENPATDKWPAWSPDGTRLAFTTDRDGNWEIYVMNADGSGLTNLTDDPERDRRPAWSPDGTRIAFESYRDDNWDIYVMNADGSGQTRLTDDPAKDLTPAWSPDGTQIGFVSNRDGGFAVYLMNADGSEQAIFATSGDIPTRIAWSPDGTHVAFPGLSQGRGVDLEVRTADGLNVTRFALDAKRDEAPAWSPDGRSIAFTTTRDGNNDEIYVMVIPEVGPPPEPTPWVNVDSGSLMNLTDNPASDTGPAWTP